MKGTLELENYDWVLFKPKQKIMLEDAHHILFVAKGSRIPLSRITNFGTADIIKHNDTGTWFKLY